MSFKERRKNQEEVGSKKEESRFLWTSSDNTGYFGEFLPLNPGAVGETFNFPLPS